MKFCAPSPIHKNGGQEDFFTRKNEVISMPLVPIVSESEPDFRETPMMANSNS